MLIANSPCSCPSGATGSTSGEFEAMGLTMYGQMTAGSWIYIGTQGILQGTYETFGACAQQALRRHAGRPARAHGRARRHGRRAAAGRDDERRRRARRRGRSRAHRAAAATRYVDRTTDSLDEALRLGRGGARAPRAAVDRAARQRGRDPARARAARRALRRRDRPDLGARSAQRLHPGRALARRGARRCASAIPRPTCTRAYESMAAQVRGDARAAARGRDRVRLRQQPARRGARTPASRDFDYPGFVPAYIRPLFCEGQGPVPLGRALRRSGGHPRPTGRCWRRSRTTSTLRPLDDAGAASA